MDAWGPEPDPREETAKLSGGSDAAGEVQAGSQLSFDSYFSCHEISGGDDIVQGDFDVDGFTGPHHPFELGSVDAGRHRNHRAVLRGELAEQDRSALQACLAEDDTGYQGVVGEVTLEKELVRLKGLAAMDGLFGLLDDFIDQEHRLAVRDLLLDLFQVHGGGGHGGCVCGCRGGDRWFGFLVAGVRLPGASDRRVGLGFLAAPRCRWRYVRPDRRRVLGLLAGCRRG